MIFFISGDHVYHLFNKDCANFYVIDMNIHALSEIKLFLLHRNLILPCHINTWIYLLLKQTRYLYIGNCVSGGTIFSSTNIDNIN